MPSRSKFARQTWCLKSDARNRLLSVLEQQPDLKRKDGSWYYRKVAGDLKISVELAKLLLDGKESSDLSKLRSVFKEYFEDEIEDLENNEFRDRYCDPCPSVSDASELELSVTSFAGDTEYLLMFKVEKYGAQQVLVKARLVIDHAPMKEALPNDFKEIKGLPSDGILIDRLGELLDQALEECSCEYGIDRGNLTVQWFLPIELLNLPVEQIQLRMGRKSYVNTGKACKHVVVRSYDLHFERFYRKSYAAWKKRWQQFLKEPSSKVSKMLPEICPEQNLPEGWRNNCDVWGSRFAMPTEAQVRDDFWDRQFMEGLPFGVWRRDGNNQAEFEGLASQSVQDLPTAIARIYQSALPDAASSQSETTIMDRPDLTNLVLLWDNPFRPFPDSIDYQSA